jgi:regulator of protease activity HflC (stomatin/prohibitin superfamily)
MAMKNTAASAILALMFASLLVIYVVVPQNDLVTFLSVVIMAIGLVIAFVGERDEIMMMAGLAGLISLAAAFFSGQAIFGNIGGVIATVAWGLALIGIARRASADTVVIPEDHAFMVAPFLSSQAFPISSSIPLTSLPFLDRHVATIPTYELTKDIQVKKVNTRSNDDVEMIEVHTRYQVTTPSQTLRGIPNRGQNQSEVAREMGLSLDRARLNVAFWEKLLAKQMSEEVDDIVRKVLFKKGSVSNIVEAYNERDDLSRAVKRELQELVGRWGVTVQEIALDYYIIDREAVKRIKGGPNAVDQEIEREKKKRKGEAEAEAMRIELAGRATNERIRQLIELLRTSHPDMKPEQIAEIVSSVLLSDALEDDGESDKLLSGPSPVGLLSPPGKK